MNTATSPRNSSGQFAKGSSGRPKGAKNNGKTYSNAEFSASVSATATAKLEGLMGKALVVIEQQLDAGDELSK